MKSSDLSHNNNQKINILILIILCIILLIFCLLIFYRYGVTYKNKLLNNIIYGLIVLYIILILVTSVLYIRYRYDNGDNIIDNINIIVKPIISVLVGLLVALFLIGTKNIICATKRDMNDVNNILLIISESRKSLPTELTQTLNDDNTSFV